MTWILMLAVESTSKLDCCWYQLIGQHVALFDEPLFSVNVTEPLSQ